MTTNRDIGIVVSVVGLFLLGFTYLIIVPLLMLPGILPKGRLLPKK